MAYGEELGNLLGNRPVWADHEIARFLFKVSMVRPPRLELRLRVPEALAE